METQCQNMTTKQRNELQQLLHKFKEFFNVTLGNWKRYPLDL